jgi:REP element-mobilizing transposase RayT
MPRPPRVEAPDALYHITARGVLKSAIVRDDHDRVRWCDYLKEAVRRFGLDLYAFALLDNHFHLFLSTPLANLGEAMQYLNGSYAAYFNARHERRGHLFENRYRAILIESQGHYTEVSRYVHLNPVRAGLVERPEECAWSSYPGYHSGRMPLFWLNYSRVLAEFGEGKAARERYREFIAEGVGRKIAPPWLHAIGGWILGSPKFAAKTYAILAKDSKGDRWDSRAASVKADIDATLDEIALAVRKHFDIAPEQLKAHDAKYREARRAFAFVAREHVGYSLKSIGNYLGLAHAGTVRRLVVTGKTGIDKNEAFRNLITEIRSHMKSG